MNKDEFRKFFMIRRTALQMLKDRGYSVDDSEINMTQAEFSYKIDKNQGKDQCDTLREKKDNPSDKIYLIFLEEDKVGVATIKKTIRRLEEDKAQRAVVVMKGLSPQAKAAIKEASPRFRIDVFEEPELVVNITEHDLVPKHKVLTDDEKKELLKRYMITDTQLPRILLIDPVARYYGLNRGQVVKITRESATASEYTSYRVAV